MSYRTEEDYSSIIESMKPVINEILSQLRSVGLTSDDLITLISHKVRNKGVSRSKVKIVIEAILQIERNIPGDKE